MSRQPCHRSLAWEMRAESATRIVGIVVGEIVAGFQVARGRAPTAGRRPRRRSHHPGDTRPVARSRDETCPRGAYAMTRHPMNARGVTGKPPSRSLATTSSNRPDGCRPHSSRKRAPSDKPRAGPRGRLRDATARGGFMRARERRLVWRATDGNAGRTSTTRPDARIAPRRTVAAGTAPVRGRKVGLDRRLSPAFKSQAGAPSDRAAGTTAGSSSRATARAGYARARERELVWQALASPRAGPSQQGTTPVKFGLHELRVELLRHLDVEAVPMTARRERRRVLDSGHLALPDLRGPRGRAGRRVRPHSSPQTGSRQERRGRAGQDRGVVFTCDPLEGGVHASA